MSSSPVARLLSEGAEQMTALFGATDMGVATGEGARTLESNDELLPILDVPRSALS